MPDHFRKISGVFKVVLIQR